MNQIAIPANLSICLFAGFLLSSSQFTIVISFAPSRIAGSFCLNPRSRRNFLIFSPKVAYKCLEIRKVTLKIRLWILVLRLALPPRKECRCTPPQIMKSINKISGPLLDRIDIHIEVSPVNPSFKGQSNGETSDKIRERVNKARDIQTERFRNDDIHSNARENRHIKKYCNSLPEAEKLLDLAMRELNLSPPSTGF